MKEITQEYLKELFNYKDGNLYWKISRSGIRKDKKAGSLNNSRYYMVKINGKLYLNHRIIYLYHNGYLPKFIDHIDRDSSNNNIKNLRAATLSQNNWNAKPNKNTSSKYKGVNWNKQFKKWIARIQINGKRISLGYFTNEIDAAIAYNNKAKELFGEFANLNKVK